jgi:hypothetical protein
VDLTAPPFGRQQVGEPPMWDEIGLPPGSRVPQLLDELHRRYPELRSHIRDTPEETFHQFLLIRQGYVLKEDDEVFPDDRLVVMMPLTGG